MNGKPPLYGPRVVNMASYVEQLIDRPIHATFIYKAILV